MTGGFLSGMTGGCMPKSSCNFARSHATSHNIKWLVTVFQQLLLL